MPTVPQLKINSDTRIRNKTLVHSILRTEVGDQFDEVGLELLLRGMPQVAATADLLAESHLNTNLILVPDYGIFKAYASVLVPDNVDSFYSADIGWLWIRVLASPVVVPDYSTFISSGGFRTWVSGYNYDVAPSTYQINGTGYAILINSNITLAPADVLLDRFDQIVVDDNQQVVVITGVPGENPQVPSHDPATQAVLGSVLVKANTVAPIVPQEWIYREDVEWTTVESHPTLVSNSPNNAAAGLLTIEATAALPAHNIRFTAPAPFSPATLGVNVLKFRIDPKAAWAVLGSGLRIQFFNGVSAVGSPVIFQNNSYGFNSSSLVYQPIVIPLASFGNLPTVSAVLITINGNAPTSLGFYLDEIELQGAAIPAGGGKYFEHGGNGWGHTAILGTRDNFDLSLILNNIERGKFTTADVFQYRGDVHLTGSNKGISFFTGSFAASDYYVKRTGTSMIVHSAGLVDLQVGQRSGVTVNPNAARGIEFYDMKTPTNGVMAQILPSGVTSLKKYGLGNLQAAPAYLAGWDNLGNFVEVPVPGGGGGGTVSSIGLGNITNFATATSDTVNPIVATGTLGYTLNTQVANRVFAGPTTGVDAVPTFRLLVAADISGLITASNGLTMSTGTNVVLGGTLSATTTITTDANALVLTGARNNMILSVTNTNATSNAYAITGIGTGVAGVGGGGLFGNSSDGYGVTGNSTNGVAVRGVASNGTAGLFVSFFGVGVAGESSITYPGTFKATSTTTFQAAVNQGIKLERELSSGTAATGFGVSFDFTLRSTTTASRLANQIISKWSIATDASRESQFIITGVNNAITGNILTLEGNGAMTLGAAYQGLGSGVLTVDNLGVVTIGGGGGGGGSVTSVTGTVNRIAITGTATDPIVNIDTNYVGQASITTLGTVGTGTWQATTVSPQYGGTGQTTYLNGELLIGNTTGSTLVKSTLSNGIGMNIVNGAGSITVNSLFNHAVQFPAVTTSALYTWNVTNGENLRWRISGTGNSLAFSNTIAGRYYTVEIIQNVGGATVTTWPAGTIWFGGIPPVLSVVTGEVDCVVFYFNGINYLAQPNALAGSITPLAGGGTGSNLSDPGADRILFWDDSANAVTWLTVGTGLNITGTNLISSGIVTADNGLTLAGTNVKLGGTLLATTTINMAGFGTIWTGNVVGTTPFYVENTNVTGTGFATISGSSLGVGIGVNGTTETGVGIVGGSYSSGIGVEGASVSGLGGRFFSNTGVGVEVSINPVSGSSVAEIISLKRSSSSAAANGIGAYIGIYNEVSDGNTYVSNQIISKFTNVTLANRVSEFSITGVDNAVTQTVLSISGNGATTLIGSLSLSVAGNKINIATGSNASVGVSAAMTAGSITISTTAVTASSRIYLTHATLGGTQGVLSVGTITAGTSFVINSSSGTDTGTVNWWIVN